MKSYIISIATATIVSAVISMVTPEKWTKYVGIVTGLVVTICVANPILHLMRSDIFEGFTYNEPAHTSHDNGAFYKEVKKELEKKLSEDIKTRLKSEFNRDCEVYTEVLMSEDGQFKGVDKIHIYGDRTDAVMIGRLYEVYDAEEVKYVGDKKVTQKQE